MIVDRWVPPPSQWMSARERRATSAMRLEQKMKGKEQSFTPPWLSQEEKSWGDECAVENSDEEVTPSPNTRMVFTKLQEQQFLTLGGGASAISGPANQLKYRTALKKHCTR